MRKRDKPKLTRPQTDEQGRPIIPGGENKREKISKSNFNILKIECNFLVRKWVKEGMDYDGANKKLKKFKEDLKERHRKLIKKGMTNKEANIQIKEDIVRFYYYT